MPNVATVLKSEISRLSAKVVRQQVTPIKSAMTSQRKQLAALRKQMQQLERQVSLLQRAAKNHSAPPPDSGESRQIRFSAKGLRSLRGRLGLSAEEFGKLVQVGGQTIYSWETAKSAPRPKHLPVIAGLRSIGKREARNRLEELNGS